MRITIISAEGTPEEIGRIEELRRFLAANGGGSRFPDEPNSDYGGQVEDGGESRLEQFIHSRGRGYPEIRLVRSFVGEVLSWPGTRPMLGRSSKSSDGLTRYVRIHAETSAVGGFVYVYPGNGRLLFRLLADQAKDSVYARPNPDRKGDYQVNLYLISEAALEEALGLARRALERARAA